MCTDLKIYLLRLFLNNSNNQNDLDLEDGLPSVFDGGKMSDSVAASLKVTVTFVQAQSVGLMLVLDGQPQRVEWRSVHPRLKHSPVWVSFSTAPAASPLIV